MNRAPLLLVAALALASCSTAGDSAPPVPSSCAPSPTAPPDQFDNRPYPLREDLPGHAGSSLRIEVMGTVRSPDCTPVPDAVVRFSAAGPSGEYSAESYGSVRTDKYGRYRFTSPMPGVYEQSGGTPHVHVSARIGAVELRDEVLPSSGVSTYQLDLVMPKGSPAPGQMP